MIEEVDFETFCKNFGFKAYPFNSFTAEDERDFQSDLFISTKLYSPLLEAYESGANMLLIGDRGTGKTSITFDFIRQSDDNHLVCEIDDYRSLEKTYSNTDLYKFVLTALVNKFFVNVSSITSIRKKLSEDEKYLLSYYYVKFASDATRGITNRKVKEIQNSKVKSFLIKTYNFFRRPFNIATNVGINILSDVIKKSQGIDSGEASYKVSEYFPEVYAGVEEDFPESHNTLEAIRRFCEIANKVGFKKIVLILDKIDEDPRLDNAAENIAEFITPILSDNTFILDKSFQFIVCLWSVPLNFIKEKVRTQKVYNPEVVWDHSDLKAAYDRRVKVFSEKTPRTFNDTFDVDVTTDLKEELLDLSNKNPRDFWHLMNSIFREQYRLNAKKEKISKEATEKGMSRFVHKFNFYEYYPRKVNARRNSMDVYGYIRHLLKLEHPSFTRNQLNEKAGTGSSTQNYTVGMESLGLIEKEATDKGEVRYRIRDPKVRFALYKGIKIGE